MLSSTSSVASVLSNVYNATNSAIMQSMSQIASGKRVQNPSDDFAAYIKAAALSAGIAGYQTVQQNLSTAHGLATYAASVGNDIAANLTKMKNLATQYAATSDANEQASYVSQYTALVNEIADEKTNSYYDGHKVYASATLGTYGVDNSAHSVAVKATAIGDETAVNDITTATTDDIQNEINNAQTYVAEMSSAADEVSKYTALVGTAINANQESVDALTNIDQASAMTKLTALQVQQQAAVSMMSQANNLQAGLARLFQ